jgi:AmpD protein
VLAKRNRNRRIWHPDAKFPGWFSGVDWHESPNFDQRPPRTRIDLLVIHYISLPDGHFAGDAPTRLFLNQLSAREHPQFRELSQLRVSSHFLITRHGGVQQFVDIFDRAWHAGVSRFGRRKRCNDFSVGVELIGDSRRPFTDSQYAALNCLTRSLTTVLPLRYVAGHSEIAPGRKPDPGPYFDWKRLRTGLQRA